MTNSQTFSKDEAIKLMQQGEKITHFTFTDNEWMTMKDGKVHLEDGVQCSPSEFWRWRTNEYWDSGYSIYKEEQDDVESANQQFMPPDVDLI